MTHAAAQDQLAVAGIEQPHAGGVGGEVGARKLGEPDHQAAEVQGAAEGTGGLGQEC